MKSLARMLVVAGVIIFSHSSGAQQPSGNQMDQYATIAGGWWLNQKCSSLAQDLRKEYEWHVAKLTLSFRKKGMDQGFLRTLQNSARRTAQQRECNSESEKIVIDTARLGAIDVPVTKVAAVGFFRSDFTHVSDLEPDEVTQTPYFGDDSNFLFRYRNDRTVTGAPLRIGGIRFQKGLGVHSRSRLSYALDGRYRAFHASIGISDEVDTLPANGRVVFRVLVDGKIAYKSPVVSSEDAALSIPAVDLTGARSIALEVDFGDDSDAGDRAIWGNPILLR